MLIGHVNINRYVMYHVHTNNVSIFIKYQVFPTAILLTPLKKIRIWENKKNNYRHFIHTAFLVH